MGSAMNRSRQFTVSPPLTEEHAAYLHRFNQTRRMQRDSKLVTAMPDPAREAVGLPVGRQGGCFVGEAADDDRYRERSIMDANKPPSGQPGLWCPWAPTKDRTGLQHTGSSSDANGKWLRYIIDHFLKPWGYTVDGLVFWEDEHASGRVKAYKNIVKSRTRYER